MRALIVDDEPLARQGVSLRLAPFRDIAVVAECDNGPAAVEAIVRYEPDIVFLDVQMPGMDGFEVLRALPAGALPAVIFVTAYEQHALSAFDAHALDYLVKPIDDDRFARAVERARTTVDAAARLGAAERLVRLLDAESGHFVSRFAVRTGPRIRIVRVDDIDWIGAAADYAELNANGHRHLIRETMTSLERRLDPAQFIRIHRSRIVRAERITELRAIDNREYNVMLRDGSAHRSSRSYADRLERWLNDA